MASYYTGLDISALQGYPINFNAIKAAGYSFCIFRNGIGNSGSDSNYSRYIANASAAGLYTACYNFIYPLPTDSTHPNRDPVSQAKFHYNTSLGQPSFVDAEWPEPQNWAQWGINASFINEWMLAYLEEYTSLSGQQPLIYTYPNWASNVNFQPQFANYKLWIASYTATPYIPKPWTDWAFWQDSSGPVKLPGTNITVDHDYAKDLSLWVQAAAPIATPPPAPIVVNTPIAAPIINSPIVSPAPAPPAPSPSISISDIISAIGSFISNLFRNRIS